MKLNQCQKNAFSGWMFILPWCIGTLCFFIIPVVLSFVFSINEIDPATFRFTYIGFEQYKSLFVEDASFLPTLFGSIRDMILSVVMIVFLSLFIANILVQKFKGRVVFRAIFFMPFIISTGLAINIITGGEYIGDVMNTGNSSQLQFTVLKTMFESSNLSTDIVDTIMTVLNEILNVSWKCGLQITLFISGLQNIPTSVKEAAKIEGATAWEYFWKIAFPMISSVLQLVLIYSVIDSFTDVSNPIISRIESLSADLNLSLSSSLACLYYGIVFIVVGIVFLIIRKKGFSYSD